MPDLETLARSLSVSTFVFDLLPRLSKLRGRVLISVPVRALHWHGQHVILL